MDARTSRLARAAGVTVMASMLAFGAALAQQVASPPRGQVMPSAALSPAMAVKPVQLPNGGVMLVQADMAQPLPGMPLAAASAPASKASLARRGLVADGALLQLANATPPPASPAVPAALVVGRVGANGQAVLARTDDAPPASAASAPQRRVVIIRDGKLPAFPEADVLYRMP